MTQPNLQMLNTGVGIVTGPGGTYGFSTYESFKLVKRYLYGKLDGNGNVTNGETETFTQAEVDQVLAILAKVEAPVYHFRIFQKSYGGGLAVVAGVGTWVGIPSLEHLELLRAMRLVSRDVTPISSDAQWAVVEDIYGRSERNDAEILTLLQSYTPEQAKALSLEIVAARIPDKTEGVPEGATPSAP